MTVRTNRRAIFAKVETTSGTAENLTQANAIPVNDISNTPLVANTVERPELTGFFGAPGFGIADKTQSITIICPILGGGLHANGSAILNSPLAPLLQCCGHSLSYTKIDLSTASSATERGVSYYKPDDLGQTTATVLYQLDGVTQQMVGARGTCSFTMVNGEFPAFTFELQSSFAKPAEAAAPTGGTRPTFQTSSIVTGNGTVKYPGLGPQFSNCVRSFTFSQGATISPRDCATREGDKAIDYLQTNRNSTGEIVSDIDPKTLSALYDVAGTEKGFAAPLTANAASALLIYGTEPGNKFYFASDNILIGAPTEGDADGFGTYTTPLVFKPLTKEDDYSFGWIGKTIPN